MVRFISLLVSVVIIVGMQCGYVLAEEQSCSAAWEQSAARGSCKPLETASSPETPPMAASEPQGFCRIRVVCRNHREGGSPGDYPNLDRLSVQRLHNCNGELKVDGC
jgi:hypothetical protein